MFINLHLQAYLSLLIDCLNITGCDNKVIEYSNILEVVLL